MCESEWRKFGGKKISKKNNRKNRKLWEIRRRNFEREFKYLSVEIVKIDETKLRMIREPFGKQIPIYVCDLPDKKFNSAELLEQWKIKLPVIFNSSINDFSPLVIVTDQA